MAEIASSVETVVAGIIAGIRQGNLSPGQRLIETDLASKFGVSRPTVREALQRLEVQGLVSQERHRGFLVRTLTQGRLEEMYQLRGALEALAAKLAAPQISANPAALEEVLLRLDKAEAAADLKGFTEANRDFHDLIRSAAGNRMVADILERLDLSVYHLQFRLLIERPGVFSTNADHHRIFDALKAGDGERAGAESVRHVEHSLAELLKLPADYFSRV